MLCHLPVVVRAEGAQVTVAKVALVYSLQGQQGRRRCMAGSGIRSIQASSTAAHTALVVQSWQL